MDLKQPRGEGGRRVALRYHPADFNLLLRRRLWAASADAPLFAGGIQSGLRPLFEHRPFKLSAIAPGHRHRYSACWCSRIDSLGQATESRPGFPEPLHERKHIPQRARQFPDHEHLTLAKLAGQPVKSSRSHRPTGGLLPIDMLAPSKSTSAGLLLNRTFAQYGERQEVSTNRRDWAERFTGFRANFRIRRGPGTISVIRNVIEPDRPDGCVQIVPPFRDRTDPANTRSRPPSTPRRLPW